MWVRVWRRSSGDDAPEVAHAFDVNVVLLVTDIVMPGMNSPDLAGRACELLRPEIWVLLMSGVRR